MQLQELLVLCNILTEFGRPMKLVRLIKMGLSETYSKVLIVKDVCDTIYVCISPSQGQLLFSLVSYVYIVLILVLHVSAVRHLQVLCIYLLAETAALPCFVFTCPHGCVSNMYRMIKSYMKLIKLVKISKITCFICSLNLGQYFHIPLVSAIRRCRLVYLSGARLCSVLLFVCFKRPVGRAVVLLSVACVVVLKYEPMYT
jgi:hypothetical protein